MCISIHALSFTTATIISTSNIQKNLWWCWHHPMPILPPTVKTWRFSLQQLVWYWSDMQVLWSSVVFHLKWHSVKSSTGTRNFLSALHVWSVLHGISKHFWLYASIVWTWNRFLSCSLGHVHVMSLGLLQSNVYNEDFTMTLADQYNRTEHIHSLPCSQYWCYQEHMLLTWWWFPWQLLPTWCWAPWQPLL